MESLSPWQDAIGARVVYAIRPTSLGWALVAASQAGICAIELRETSQAAEQSLPGRFPGAVQVTDDPAWLQEVIAFLEAPARSLDLPLDMQGTAFQRRVWLALREIPPGKTATYTEIAAQIGAPKAVRAVARGCASNRIAVAIPCHRVIRSDGGLGGYRWGLSVKRALLDREKSQK